VLIDGRRMPPGDPTQPVADLNLIPSALVDSVDVMTGGASSVYGSDAIAGVVNFKMKHNFEGLQIDAQYDFAEHDNNNSAAERIAKASGFNVPTGNAIQGRTEHVTLTFGTNSADGKGNVEGYLGYSATSATRSRAPTTPPATPARVRRTRPTASSRATSSARRTPTGSSSRTPPPRRRSRSCRSIRAARTSTTTARRFPARRLAGPGTTRRPSTSSARTPAIRAASSRTIT
jgi:outer membrane receptor protein involved in Fe transport